MRGRFCDHRRALEKGKHHSRYLQRGWNKYGGEVFIFEAMIICKRDDLFFYEQRSLDKLRPAYNISKSADAPRGFKWTADQRSNLKRIRNLPDAIDKAREKAQIQMSDPANRAKCSPALRGPDAEMQRKSKLKKSGLLAWKDPQKKERMLSSLTNDETLKKKISGYDNPGVREKISAAWKGKKRSAEDRARKSAAMTGKKLPHEQIAKIKESWKNPEVKEKRMAGLRAIWAANKLEKLL
jgi:hypothetical protein